MKRLSSLILCSLIILIPLTVEAQLINYGRRNRKSVPTPPASVAPATDEQNRVLVPVFVGDQEEHVVIHERPEADSQIKSTKPWGAQMVAVTTRVEKIYDLDDDGILQADEIEDFLRDVLASVQSRGNFTVSSPLLEFFDEDGDGQINRYEAYAIRDLLDQP